MMVMANSRRFRCEEILLIFFFLSVFSVHGQGNGLCGPGSSIEVAADRRTVRVRPSGQAPTDRNLIASAIASVASGGVIDLCEGTFYLGEEDGSRTTVFVTKGVTFRGRYANGAWNTIVKGGGEDLAFFVPSTAIGAFFVNSASDPNPVIFDGVWIREWGAEGIVLFAVNGFVFRNSKITHPRVAGSGFPLGVVNYVHGIMALNNECLGDFNVTNSHFDVTDYGPIQPSDSNAIALYGFPSTRFSRIVIENNDIRTNDEGIELHGNQPLGRSQIFIRNNRITAEYDVDYGWIGHYAILIAGNRNIDTFLVEDNVLTLRNGTFVEERFYFDTGAMSITGDNIVVRNNKITAENFAGMMIRIGNSGDFTIADFGSSIYDSLFENNEVTGLFKGVGVYFTGCARNQSRRNIFRLGSSFAKSGGRRPIVHNRCIQVCDNVWEGDLRFVNGALDTRCEDTSSNNGDTPAQTPPSSKMASKGGKGKGMERTRMSR